MRTDAPIISCYHLQVPGPERPLLDDVSFDIASGSWNEIVGPSGCGKSLLFSVLSLRGAPPEGRLVVGGRNFDRIGPDEVARVRLRLGSCAQHPRLLEDRTVLENLVLPFVVRREEGRALRACESALEALELEGLRDRPVHALCHQDRLAVGLLRALVGEPEVIIVDGAHEALESERQKVVLQQLRRRQHAGAAVIVLGRAGTEHARAGQQLRMSRGRIDAVETPVVQARVPEAGGRVR